MGRRGARLRPSRPSDRDPRLCLVLADRGQHETAILCRAAHGANKLPAGGSAGGDRRRESGEIAMRKAAGLLVTLCVSALPVDARDAFQVIGAGVDSCGTWTAESR
jgi:hypothetical protein